MASLLCRNPRPIINNGSVKNSERSQMRRVLSCSDGWMIMLDLFTVVITEPEPSSLPSSSQLVSGVNLLKKQEACRAWNGHSYVQYYLIGSNENTGSRGKQEA